MRSLPFPGRSSAFPPSRYLLAPDRRFWALHYERHRCTHCRTKKRPHCSCGMCTQCYPKIFGQKRAIEKELSKGR